MFPLGVVEAPLMECLPMIWINHVTLMPNVGCMFALIFYQKKLKRVKRTNEFQTINLEIYQYGCQTKVRSNLIQTHYI